MTYDDVVTDEDIKAIEEHARINFGFPEFVKSSKEAWPMPYNVEMKEDPRIRVSFSVSGTNCQDVIEGKRQYGIMLEEMYATYNTMKDLVRHLDANFSDTESAYVTEAKRIIGRVEA